MSFKHISVEKHGDGGIYIVTLKKPPENRLNVEACQELIRAYRGIVSRYLRQRLGMRE